MTGGPEGTPALKIWGGLECTVNRVGDGYLNQLDRNGHASRPDDLERFATLGIQAIRYPLLWELMAPDGLDAIDWRWSDERMATLRRLGIRPIVGLVHHGSGPRHTDLLDPAFAIGLADYAGAVAARYPWVTDWTPVNEPLTTARFAALYGVWYPHARDDASFVRALLNQVRATVLAMRAIRQVNPNARLVQTEDLGKTYSTKPLVAAAGFYNERRWLSWDLLCGRVDSTHALWDYLTGAGADAAELLWFRDNPCPPDVVGVNYYVTGERWIDHRPERYPEAHRGAIGGRMVADIEAARALATPTPGIGALLDEAWSRYRLPIAITEVHIDAHREDQLRWLVEVWRAAEGVRRDGAEVIAVTVWALLGSFDWNGLVCAPRGYYEPGPFDVRSPTPRPTALATLVRSLAAGEVPAHPALHHEGWWRRPGRFFCKPVSNPTVVMPLKHYREALPEGSAAPILISGASGTLGRAFARACAERHLSYRLLTRGEMDIADSASVAAALELHRPWAVINASGYVRIDAAETEPDRCHRENTIGPTVLARHCAGRGIALQAFSSDQVFSGESTRPWVESDPTAPLNAYGRSKADAEVAVLAEHPAAMVIRTSAFFGPWDPYNFVAGTLRALAAGEEVRVADDERISPTYVPDLVKVCLDLLIDAESGLWHLANVGDVSWAELADRAAALAGVDASGLQPCAAEALGLIVPRPRYGVLGSERAALMPSLDDALQRFMSAVREQRATVDDTALQAAVSAGH